MPAHSPSQEAIPVGRKWENIKRGKAKLDQARGAAFSQVAKDIMKAAREGGPDPEANFRLKVAIETAREVNMPNDNIQRAIQRGAGLVEGIRYEDFDYEGYGPGGVAVMMNISTDNRNRTAAEVRHAFTKAGGAMGETGCVSWMFTKKGVVHIDRSLTKVSEDDLMMLALEAGADDLQADAESFEITTAPEALDGVLRALKNAKIPVASGDTEMVPNNTVELSGEHAEKMFKLLDVLEENDDIQNVYHNAEFE
jgi:YebC/PmpR family DNA-binding regulatory protein